MASLFVLLRLTDRNDSRARSSLVQRAEGGLEVGGVEMGVDVRGRPDVGVAGKRLRELQVPGLPHELRDRRVARLMHGSVDDCPYCSWRNYKQPAARARRGR